MDGNSLALKGQIMSASTACTRLSRRMRIVRTDRFTDAYEHGRCIKGRMLTMWIVQTGGGAPRLGVVTGRKVGKAVERVRARRLMREAFRINRSRLIDGVDIVLSARSAIVGAKRRDVEAELMLLAKKTGTLRKMSEVGSQMSGETSS